MKKLIFPFFLAVLALSLIAVGFAQESAEVTDTFSGVSAQTEVKDKAVVEDTPAVEDESVVVDKAVVEDKTPTKESLAFTDVARSAYYYEPVRWSVEKGITNGTSATKFSPDMLCTRAHIITFLWRAAGCPATNMNDGKLPFADISLSAYYVPALEWAVTKGVVAPGKVFGPDEPCSRGEVVLYMHRSQGCPDAELSKFGDVSPTAEFAKAVGWAVNNGYATGVSEFTFAPQSTCTRGQIVTFLWRMYNYRIEFPQAEIK